MTSPFGENPPRPENEASEPDAAPQDRTARDRESQADLWSEDSRDSASSGEDAPWSREGRRPGGVNGPEAERSVAATEPAPVFINDDDEVAAQRTSASSSVRVRRVAWELIQTLVLAALIFLMVRGVAQNFRVEGPSMEPGLHNGQYLLVNKAVYFKLDLDTLSKYIPFVDGGDNPSRFLFHGPRRGDVIVFRYPRDPSRDFIKRIIGIPGDTMEIRNGVVTVNGVALEEPYINDGARSDMSAKVVPKGSYFVMGDNRPNSSDSRSWGFVPEENIIGKAMFSYWPMSEFGGVGNTSIDLGFIKVPVPF